MEVDVSLVASSFSGTGGAEKEFEHRYMHNVSFL